MTDAPRATEAERGPRRSLPGAAALVLLLLAPFARAQTSAAGPPAHASRRANPSAQSEGAAPGEHAEGPPEDSSAPDDAAEVVVTVARSAALTAGSSRVTARQFAFVPRRTAEDALELVPGLTLVQHGSEGKGHQFFLRGFDAIHGADLELSVEGIPINEWSNVHAQGYLDLGFVIPEVVSAVEVIKGPFSLDQGAFAMAGSARYALAVAPSELGWRVVLGAGTTGRARGVVTYAPPGSDGRSFAAAELLHDEGYGQRRGIDRSSLLGQATLLDSEQGRLTALAALYVARFELPGALRADDLAAGRVGFFDVYDRGARGDSRRLLGALSYERDGAVQVRARLYGSRRELGLLENFTGYLIDPLAGDRREQAHVSTSAGAEADFALRPRPWLGLVAGVGVRGEAIAQHQDHVDGAGVALARERGLGAEQALFHAKAGVVLEPGGGLRVTAGARLDVAHLVARDAAAAGSGELGAGPANGDSGTLSAVSPRLAIALPLAAGTELFAAYGRGFRPPEARALSSFEPERTGLSEDLYTGGDPALTRADSFELGARADVRSVGAGLTGFATFIERESIYDHVSGINLELDGTRRLGAELELSARPWTWLELRGFSTFVDARFTGSGNPVPLAPRYTGGASLTAAREQGPRAGLRALVVAPRPLPHGARGATLVSVDMTLGWHFERVRLDLELENVLDRRLREGEYHYASHWRPGEPASQIPVTQIVGGPPFNARASATLLF